MEEEFIYLAGKIQSDGWRQSIVDIRNSLVGYQNDYDKQELINVFKRGFLRFNNYYLIKGPFFISCDHSCYHGDGSHGVGINIPCKYGCYGEKLLTEQEVIDICKYQIEHSDIIFAFINDDTCYGSLWEIGYAKALGKKIITVFDTNKRQKDMWFISETSDCTFNLEQFSVINENKILADACVKSTDESLNPIAKIFAYKIMNYDERNRVQP